MMSSTAYFLDAFLIGIAIAAPVGPIGILCIKKTLDMGFKGTLSVGLGAAMADAVYGLIAGAGLTVISNFLLGKVAFIRVLGAFFLFYLAYKELISKLIKSKSVVPKNTKPFSIISKTFLLTLTNPMTILSFLGIFSSLSGDNVQFLDSIWMVSGIFAGSMFWWIVLGTLIMRIRRHLSDQWMHYIKMLSAAIFVGFGLYALIESLLE